jgi:hypothetical protein
MPSIFIRDKLILSSKRILHKAYGRKDSVAKKNSGHEPEEAWRQDELISSIQPAVK